MPQLFTDPDAWSGGFYELSMELSPQGTIDVAAAEAALWSLPDLFGGFARKDREPNEQHLLPTAGLPFHGHRYGVAQLGTGHLCVCGSYTIAYNSSRVWLCLYLPIGGLVAVYPALGGFPFGQPTKEQRQVRDRIDEWLLKQAIALYPRIVFAFAVIGFESDYSILRERVSESIPNKRREGLVVPTSSGLHWYPPTE